MNKQLLTLALSLITTLIAAQTPYRYSVDLKAVRNDKLEVTLLTPSITSKTTVYAFPKIIPGTYAISDYGKFIDSLRAFDASGKTLKVARLNDNQWQISNANKMTKITYLVEDIFDTNKEHSIYPMAATDIEENKNYVIHTPGFFGYFNDIRKTPVELSFQKPSNFYASTALSPVSSTAVTDLFRVNNIDDLYDSPIMYTLPDTATIQVANCKVLVSVYSPNKVLHAKEISNWLSGLLNAAKNYLGGKLPADRYAFLYYFKDPKDKHSFRAGLGGALEHTTSSFYYLGEGPAERLKNTIIDVSSHEFFHIITPLTISSREVKEFNFNEPVLSKHLWLYEGSTEYTAHHVQVRGELNTVPQFLSKLSGKITNSRKNYNDTLSFTQMSKLAASTYADQYNNVYEKGALISACLDLLLLNKSDGNYGLKNLTHDLGVRYGKTRYFNDDDLFDVIAELTYPDVKDFLVKYVQGTTPIPYEYYFGLAGIKYTPLIQKKVVSFGGIVPGLTQKGGLYVSPNSRLNAFGQKLGYKIGDELYSFNGRSLTANSFGPVVEELKQNLKEGDMFQVKIGRAGADGKIDTMVLSSLIEFITQNEENRLELMENPSAKQSIVQKVWLEGVLPSKAVPVVSASPKDVESIDAIVKALYSVISGPAGVRNWNRFYSLFLPEASMGASGPTPQGDIRYFQFTPLQYQKVNAPFFAQAGFFEEELSRKISAYGNIASVQSVYQSRFEEKGKVTDRGINYITLVKSNGRWWISSLNWQQETKENPLPKETLKK